MSTGIAGSVSDPEEAPPRERDKERGAKVGGSGGLLHLFQGFVRGAGFTFCSEGGRGGKTGGGREASVAEAGQGGGAAGTSAVVGSKAGKGAS